MTVIGILPAAGNATRLHGLPKYLLPIPGGYLLKRHIQCMKPLCRMVTIGNNPDNEKLIWCYEGDANSTTVAKYATMTETVIGTHDNLVNMYDFNPDITYATTLFGMPDTYFTSDDVYPRLLTAIDNGADVAVGVFHTRFEQRSKLGMCRVQSGRVTEVVDKPECTNLHWAWGVLAWRPVFWDCLRPEMPHVGYGLPCAIESGLDVRAVEMDGQYFDCGTPEEYFQCIRTITAEKELA